MGFVKIIKKKKKFFFLFRLVGRVWQLVGVQNGISGVARNKSQYIQKIATSLAGSG